MFYLRSGHDNRRPRLRGRYESCGQVGKTFTNENPPARALAARPGRTRLAQYPSATLLSQFAGPTVGTRWQARAANAHNNGTIQCDGRGAPRSRRGRVGSAAIVRRVPRHRRPARARREHRNRVATSPRTTFRRRSPTRKRNAFDTRQHDVLSQPPSSRFSFFSVTVAVRHIFRANLTRLRRTGNHANECEISRWYTFDDTRDS